MPRVFVSIEISDDISDDIRDQLVKTQKELVKTGADLKLVEPENIHLTLRFLGDVPEERLEDIKEAVRAAKNDVNPFLLQVSGLGVFPKPSYIRVIWAGVGKGRDDTTAIRNKLDLNLPKIKYTGDKRKFTPHLTIARVKSDKARNKLLRELMRMSDKSFGACQVDALELKKSKLYSTTERFELG